MYPSNKQIREYNHAIIQKIADKHGVSYEVARYIIAHYTKYLAIEMFGKNRSIRFPKIGIFNTHLDQRDKRRKWQKRLDGTYWKLPLAKVEETNNV